MIFYSYFIDISLDIYFIDILFYRCFVGFSNFLYLPQIRQFNFFISTFLVMGNILVFLSFFSYSLGENKFTQSSKPLPFLIKSINQIQKYPYIIELYTCIL